MVGSKNEQNFKGLLFRIHHAKKTSTTLAESDKRRLYNIQQPVRKGKYQKVKQLQLQEAGINFESKLHLGTIIDKKFDEFCNRIMQSKIDPSYSMSRKDTYILRKINTKIKKGEYCAMKKTKLESAGVNFGKSNDSEPEIKYVPSITNTTPRWKKVITKLSKQQNNGDLEWLQNHLSLFSQSFIQVEDFKSVAEYVLKSMKVGDIDPISCKVNSPATNIHHTLSYFICQEFKVSLPNIFPSQKSITGRSIFFRSDDALKFKEFKCTVNNVIENVIPIWLQKYIRNEITLNEEELIVQISKSDYMFDPFPVSVMGTNFKKGITPITMTKQPGPRRFNLSDSFQDASYSKYYNCHLFFWVQLFFIIL